MRPVPAMPTVLMVMDVLRALTLLEFQDVAGFIGACDLGAQDLDDLDGTLGEGAVRSIDTLVEIEIVLEADADMAPEQDRLRHHRKLVATDAEGGPDRILRQFADLIGHGLGVDRRAPGNAEAELKKRGIIDQAFGDELLGEPKIARIEDFHFGLHAIRLDEFGLFAQLRRRLHHDRIAVAEIERTAIERADLRTQILHMCQALDRADEIGIGFIEFARAFAGADFDVAAHAGGQVDDHRLVLGADALHDLGIELDIAGALAGLHIAHMAVDDGGTG